MCEDEIGFEEIINECEGTNINKSVVQRGNKSMTD